MGAYQENPDLNYVYVRTVAIQYVDITLSGWSRSQISRISLLELTLYDNTSDYDTRPIISNGVAQGTVYDTPGGVKIRMTWPFYTNIDKYVKPTDTAIGIIGPYNEDVSFPVEIMIDQLYFIMI